MPICEESAMTAECYSVADAYSTPVPEIPGEESGEVNTLWFSGPFFPGWEIVTPVFLKAEQDEDGEYLVSDDFSTVYGNAKSELAALEDYCNSLMDYYDLLKARAAHSPQAAVQFYRLQRYVRKLS